MTFLKHCREVIHEYTVKLRPIINNVFKAMALSLNLEENCFLNQFGERGVMFARFNYYPRCPRPDIVLGLKPHADGSAITVVLPDREVEGLQFMHDGQWFRVPTIPGALLINLGDQVEVSPVLAYFEIQKNASEGYISIHFI